MKKLCIILTITISGIILSSGYSMACHEEAMGGDGGIWPTLRGHNPSSRANGLLVFTESTTAVSSTTTSCDAYTGFFDEVNGSSKEDVISKYFIPLDSHYNHAGVPENVLKIVFYQRGTLFVFNNN